MYSTCVCVRILLMPLYCIFSFMGRISCLRNLNIPNFWHLTLPRTSFWPTRQRRMVPMKTCRRRCRPVSHRPICRHRHPSCCWTACPMSWTGQGWARAQVPRLRPSFQVNSVCIFDSLKSVTFTKVSLTISVVPLRAGLSSLHSWRNPFYPQDSTNEGLPCLSCQWGLCYPPCSTDKGWFPYSSTNEGWVILTLAPMRAILLSPRYQCGLFYPL